MYIDKFYEREKMNSLMCMHVYTFCTFHMFFFFFITITTMCCKFSIDLMCTVIKCMYNAVSKKDIKLY